MKNIRNKIGVIGASALMLIALNGIGVSFATSLGENPLETLLIEAEEASITIMHTDESDYKTDYDSSFFKVEEKVNDDMHVFTIEGIVDTENRTYEDRVFLYIPKEKEYKEVKILSNDSAISVDKIDAELNITGMESAVGIRAPEVLKHNITYISDESAGSIRMDSSTTDFKIILETEDSSFSFPYDEIASTGNYKKGNGSNVINIKLKDSAFSFGQKIKNK